MNNIALITGGSRGLGRSMALHLAEAGVDVVLTYKSNAVEAGKVVEEIRKLGRKAVAVALDVEHAETFAAFAEQVKGELRATWQRDRFDFLVNNAGIAGHAAFGQITAAQLDQLFAIHLKAPVLLTQALLPMMNDGGRILNVSSGLARFSLPGYAAYGAMKGGVEVLTRYMAKELAARKITVNVLAPGAIETDFGGGTVRDNPQVNKMVTQMTALGRVGLPDDIGKAAALLLSSDAQWMTGQRVEFSGGMQL